MTLTSLFSPRSVAIIGASDDPKRIGGRILANLLRGGYGGSIYPVNPNRETVQGRQSFPSIEALPEVVDLVAIAVGGSEGLAYLKTCCEAGAQGVIVFASEIGTTSDELPGLLAKGLLRKSSTRLLGPNSNGIINPAIGLYASFTSMLDLGLPRPGSVAVATQSAGVGASYTLEYLRRRALGIRFWCHVGGEADVSLDEVLCFYAVDRGIRSVVINFETPHRPKEFTAAVASLRRAGMHVSGFHAGSSEMGQAAAATHTGILTSVRPRVLLGVSAQSGMRTSRSVRQLCNDLEAHTYLDGKPSKLNLAVVSTSGGVGVSLSDSLAEIDQVALPPLDDRARRQLTEMVPFASLANPIDLTAQINNQPELMARVLRTIEEEGGLDGLIVYLPSGDLGDVVAEAVAQCRPRAGCVVIAVGLASDAARERLHRAGVAVFDEPDDLGQALSSWFAEKAMSAGHPAACRGAPSSGRPVLPSLRGLKEKAIPAVNDASRTNLVLDEASSKAYLEHAGLRVPRSCHIESKDDVLQSVDLLGFPLAMKLLSPGVSHKAARGHVRLAIRDLASAVEAADELLDLRDTYDPGALVVVEEMALGVAEVFVGVRRDDEFGALVVLARGGVDVERPESRATVSALPATGADVERMLASTGLVLPTGAAGVRLHDELTDLVATLGELLAAGEPEGLDAVDVNPVVVEREGHCVLVDALLSFKVSGAR